MVVLCRRQSRVCDCSVVAPQCPPKGCHELAHFKPCHFYQTHPNPQNGQPDIAIDNTLQFAPAGADPRPVCAAAQPLSTRPPGCCWCCGSSTYMYHLVWTCGLIHRCASLRVWGEAVARKGCNSCRVGIQEDLAVLISLCQLVQGCGHVWECMIQHDARLITPWVLHSVAWGRTQPLPCPSVLLAGVGHPSLFSSKPSNLGLHLGHLGAPLHTACSSVRPGPWQRPLSSLLATQAPRQVRQWAGQARVLPCFHAAAPVGHHLQFKHADRPSLCSLAEQLF